METDARKRARAAYRDRCKIVRVVMEIPQEVREKWRERAQSLGLSLTAYIVSLVNADLAGVPADLSGIPADSADQTEG